MFYFPYLLLVQLLYKFFFLFFFFFFLYCLLLVYSLAWFFESLFLSNCTASGCIQDMLHQCNQFSYFFLKSGASNIPYTFRMSPCIGKYVLSLFSLKETHSHNMWNKLFCTRHVWHIVNSFILYKLSSEIILQLYKFNKRNFAIIWYFANDIFIFKYFWQPWLSLTSE